ncbi:MAG: cell division protein FtsZ [Candidatus Azobacteroides sp.]|nr:cell division protein FtsZ [Candidatus Azobacteroides sp.]
MEDLMESGLINFDFPARSRSILKVVGVGGGGGNAVTQMYREGIRDVTFVLCNTDSMAMIHSPIPVKVQLGSGLGAGGKPEVARKAAEDSIEALKQVLSDETEMVFITAGMGGGTGTGASPIVARVAKELGILTIGIVTIPFMFEGNFKIIQALKGVEAIKKNVDALLVINNERLRDVYSDLSLPDAFKRADETLTIAVRSISEIITIPGYINLDFADVKTILKDGGVAIMSSGLGRGDNRVSQAIENALNSPLLNNNDVFKAKKILLNIAFGSLQPIMMEEFNEIHDFMAKFSSDIEVIWGTALDESLEDRIKIAILASGFGIENIVSTTKGIEEELRILDEEEIRRRKAEEDRKKVEEEERLIYEAKLIKKYYGPEALRRIGQTTRPHPFIFTFEDIDDNDTIEAVINNPAYNRSPRVMLDIAKKAEARKRESA